jgi:gliding motility-associated lipoprotein GldH
MLFFGFQNKQKNEFPASNETFLSFAFSTSGKHQPMKSKASVIFHKYISGFLIAAVVILGSCGSRSVYDRSIEISERGWHEDSIVVFDDVIISDTISLHNFYINLRHSTDYRYSNFYLFLNTTLPNGRITRDTIEMILADNYGKWYGKGFGHIRENRILVRQNLKFPLKGSYRFAIEQAMREDDRVLEGMRNVGIRIE